MAVTSLSVGAGGRACTAGGFGFGDPEGDGIRYVALQPGAAGTSGVAPKGKGAGLAGPPLPLAPPLTVRLIAAPEPLMVDTVSKLRDDSAAHADRTPGGAGALVSRCWRRLASDWIRFGTDACAAVFRNAEVADAPSPRIDQATIAAWRDDSTAFLRP